MSIAEITRSFHIVPYVKLNGKTRYNVFYNDMQLGQFYTRQNARRFIDKEAMPAILKIRLTHL